MAFVELKNINFKYSDSSLIFQNLTLDIHPADESGFICGIMGPSGSGKSTLLKLFLDLEKPQNGKLHISPKTAIVSYIPQEPVIFEHLSIYNNATYFSKIFNYKEKFSEKIVKEISGKLGLNELLNSSQKIINLSGGEKQRIALLRALSIKPDILLLDEPLSGIDDLLKEDFLNTLIEFSTMYNILVFYVSHHFNEINSISDSVLFIDKLTNKNEEAKITFSSIQEFKLFPPSTKAFKIANAFDGFLLPISINTENEIHLTGMAIKSKIKFEGFLGVKNENIILSNKIGFPFNCIKITNSFNLIYFKETTLKINIPSSLFNNSTNENIAFQGDMLLYNINGSFHTVAEIMNNKIVNIKE